MLRKEFNHKFATKDRFLRAKSRFKKVKAQMPTYFCEILVLVTIKDFKSILIYCICIYTAVFIHIYNVYVYIVFY